MTDRGHVALISALVKLLYVSAVPSPSPVLIHPLKPLTLRLPLPHFHSVTISLPVRLSQAPFLLLLHIITQFRSAICLSVSLLYSSLMYSYLLLSSLVLSELWAHLLISAHTRKPLCCVYVCICAVVVMHGQSWGLALAHVDGSLSLPPKCFGNTRDLLSCQCN